MVGGKMQFNAIFGQRALLDSGNASAVDEDVDLRDVGPGEDSGSGGSDRFLAGEVNLQQPVVHIRVLGFKGINAGLEFGWSTPGEDEAGRTL
jgi:hypothetical protein